MTSAPRGTIGWQERLCLQVHDFVARLLDEIDDPVLCDERAPDPPMRLVLRVDPGG